MSGPLSCVRADVGAEGAGTQILARKVFSTNNPPPPHLSSQNDQRDVGIILSHRCWPPPPRHGRSGTPAVNPPSRHGGQGGGLRVGKMGLRVTPPPKSNFLAALYRQSRVTACRDGDTGNVGTSPPVTLPCHRTGGPRSSWWRASALHARAFHPPSTRLQGVIHVVGSVNFAEFDIRPQVRPRRALCNAGAPPALVWCVGGGAAVSWCVGI